MKRNKIIDLGMHPFSDTFITEQQLSLSEPIFPLTCYLDSKSGLIKTGVDTNTYDRYNLYDYSYTSSNSNLSKNHWKNFAKYLLEKNYLDKNSSVLEIGSNDGYLSLQLKEFVKKIIGIDSSKHISELATKKGLLTIPEFFSFTQSNSIKSHHGIFDIVLANNVLNHIDDLDDFCQGINNILSDDGKFIFEVPYWKNTILDFRYDQIYLEHVNYFTLKSIHSIFKKYNLFIEEFEEVDYHGGSLRVILSKKNKENNKLKLSIEKEVELGLFSLDTYSKYQKKIEDDRSKLIIKLHEIKLKGFPIIAIGAAAKGNTYLNFHKLDSTIIDYVTDSSIHKIGKYTPLSRIKILSDNEVLDKYDKVYALILSWNLAEVIKPKLKELNNNIQFIN